MISAAASVRRPPSLARRALPLATTVVAAATIAAGLILRWRTRLELGTPLPPFLMSWSPHLAWPALGAGAGALAALLAMARGVRRARSGAAFAALSYAVCLALGLAVAAARRGPAGWAHVFDLSGHGSFEATREYLPALRWLRGGVHAYVSHFAQLLPSLPTHTKGNPPGPVVAMHLLSITTAGRLAAACVVIGAAVAPLTYVLARLLGGERRGRLAAALTAFSPAVVIYGFTSVDYVFAAFGVAVACLLVSPRAGLRATGCVAAGAAAFFSWVLLAIPVWAVVVVLAREGRRAAARLAAGAAAGILLVTAALGVAWGYDPIAILHAISRIYGAGAAAHRPYAYWVLGSPAAWLAMLGLPIAWLSLRSLAHRDPAAVALAAVVVLSAVAGFTKGETERIWLPYVPLACASAAAAPVRRLGLVLMALAVQSVVIETLFGTVW